MAHCSRTAGMVMMTVTAVKKGGHVAMTLNVLFWYPKMQWGASVVT